MLRLGHVHTHARFRCPYPGDMRKCHVTLITVSLVSSGSTCLGTVGSLWSKARRARLYQAERRRSLALRAGHGRHDVFRLSLVLVD